VLAIYLNDHLAGATAAVELARRAARSNRESAYGPFLEQLARELDQDRESLLDIMRGLGVGVDRLKVLGAWGSEKLGRLKLNGRVLGYSPLSRVVELEILSLAVQGKLALWRLLETLDEDLFSTGEVDFSALVDRALVQIRDLERHRLDAAEAAFATRGAG
jgi:hypothetical protein